MAIGIWPFLTCFWSRAAACANRKSYQKVVLLTNFATPDIRRRAKELGADAVFDKSTELDALFDFCREQAELCY